MIAYFVAGNFWLFVTLLLIVGRQDGQYQNTSAWFGIGASFYPPLYGLLVFVVLLISVYFFLCYMRSIPEPESDETE